MTSSTPTPGSQSTRTAEVDTDVIQTLSAVMPRYASVIRRALLEEASETRLTLTQLRTLQTIERATPPGVPNSRLARLLGIAPPSMTAMVDSLVARDLVERRADPTDRRQAHIIPTERGQALMRGAEQRINDQVRALLCHLDDAERERLFLAMLDLKRSMEASERETASTG